MEEFLKPNQDVFQNEPSFFGMLAVELDKYNLVLVPQPNQSATKNKSLVNHEYNPHDCFAFFMIQSHYILLTFGCTNSFQGLKKLMYRSCSPSQSVELWLAGLLVLYMHLM